MSPNLAGARVVVTGAGHGLGEAMAVALCEAGASVTLASRPGAHLDQLAARLRGRGLLAEPVAVDVRDPASVTLAAREAVVRMGGVDMVVNNAGIGMRTVNPRFPERAQPFFEVDPERFIDLVATNLTGYFLVSRAFALLFLEQGHGRFANVSINRATMVREGFAPYGPSRAGSEALSMVMTEDLRPYNVAVNVLLPGGATDTGMIPDAIGPETRARLLRPEIMGPPAVFLASEEAQGLTGSRIVATEFDQWLADYRAGRLEAAPGPLDGP
jgi:NAD(P)-dependent dehydrogenase (short-subunit alcohol dehydrogenase family)